MASNDAASHASADVPARITPGVLSRRYVGSTERWWRERMPDLVDAGAASRVGRRYFARLSAIDAWLESGGQVAKRRGR
jgi:hypothetical protein